jgi:hypothetical protein
MGVGQIYPFLIPKNDKNPLPLLFPSKEAQGLMIFDFLRPDCSQKNTGADPSCQWALYIFLGQLFPRKRTTFWGVVSTGLRSCLRTEKPKRGCLLWILAWNRHNQC